MCYETDTGRQLRSALIENRRSRAVAFFGGSKNTTRPACNGCLAGILQKKRYHLLQRTLACGSKKFLGQERSLFCRVVLHVGTVQTKRRNIVSARFFPKKMPPATRFIDRLRRRF